MPSTSYDAIVPRCPSAVGATKPGTSVMGKRSDGIAEGVGGRTPAGAEDDDGLVAGYAGHPGDPGGRLLRQLTGSEEVTDST